MFYTYQYTRQRAGYRVKLARLHHQRSQILQFETNEKSIVESPIKKHKYEVKRSRDRARLHYIDNRDAKKIRVPNDPWFELQFIFCSL